MEDEDEYDATNDVLLNDYFMYKICPKNKNLKMCYIGHTKNMDNRARQHELEAINTDHSKSHQKHYEAIRNNGGWNNWEMIVIDKIFGKTFLEARMREQELMNLHEANLNTLKAYITEEERQLNKKNITAQFRIDNKAQIRAKEKEYKEIHKEKIAEQMRLYRDVNKEKIQEQTKEYREKNKEKQQENQKIWMEKNKEILKEKRKITTAKKKQQKIEDQLKEQNEKEETI
jgi:hypothetical protein